MVFKAGLVDLQVCQNLGFIHSERNQLDSSNFFYYEGLKVIRPDNSNIFSLKEELGKNYYTMKDYQKAIDLFNEALDLELTDGFWITYRKNKVIIDIAAIYQDKLNDKFKAIEYYEMVKEPEISICKLKCSVYQPTIGSMIAKKILITKFLTDKTLSIISELHNCLIF